MVRIAAWMLLLLSSCMANAQSKSGFRLLDVDYVAVDYRKILPGKREGYLPERDGEWTNGADFNLNLRFAEYFRWDNRFHMDGVDSRLLHVGWEYRLILDKYPLQPFYYHHSQHALEDAPRGRKFPVEDSYGLRMVFWDRGGK
jgi:hypothetical protein